MLHRFKTPARHATPKTPRRKRKWLVLAVVAPLLIGGAAFAYFNLDQATSHVNVATTPNFMISIAQPTGTALSPGSGTETVLFSVVNQVNTQTLNSATYALTSDTAGGIYDTVSNTYIDSCLASWFDVSGTLGAGITLPMTVQAGQAIYTGSITVTMPADPTDNQTACEGLSPQVSVTLN